MSPVTINENTPPAVASGTEAEAVAAEPLAPNREHNESEASQVECIAADGAAFETAIESAPGNVSTSPSYRVSPPSGQISHSPVSADPNRVRALVDKSTLSLGEPKRLRNVEHLRFVASEPCLICGRQPSQAHHLRFTQPRALGKKVSDEFTVPLCAFHHDEVHRAGAEIKWWQARRVEPIAIAHDLWARSHNFETVRTETNEPAGT